MARIAHEMLADLDKETVDFVPNYDESESEPSVFPTRLPNLLVNGSAGIAVGMATNIPPHNLGEVVDACVAYIDDPTIDVPGSSAGTRFSHRRRHQRGARDPRGLHQRPRSHLCSRSHPFRGRRQRRPSAHRGHRAALPGQQGAPARQDCGAGQGQAHRRHQRASRRVGQGRHAHGDRAQARRSPRRGAEQPVSAHHAADRVRHQSGGADGRSAAAAELEAADRGLRASPPRGGDAADHLRPAQGARSRPRSRGSGGGAGEHRSGDRGDQGVAEPGRGEAGADGSDLGAGRGGGDAQARRRRAVAAGRAIERVRTG